MAWRVAGFCGRRSTLSICCDAGLGGWTCFSCPCRTLRAPRESSADLIHFLHENLQICGGRFINSAIRGIGGRFDSRTCRCAVVGPTSGKDRQICSPRVNQVTCSGHAFQDCLRGQKLRGSRGGARQRGTQRAADFPQTSQFDRRTGRWHRCAEILQQSGTRGRTWACRWQTCVSHC